MLSRWGAAAVLVLALASGCSSSGTTPASTTARPPVLVIRTGTTDAVVHPLEIADTEAERERGLMGRSRLRADAGMAFVFDGPTTDGFWMKDTLIPLDIAFWDADGRIVQTFTMTPCRADPCPIYRPDAEYVGAVEVNAGWLARHHVEVGDRVQLRASA